MKMIDKWIIIAVMIVESHVTLAMEKQQIQNENVNRIVCQVLYPLQEQIANCLHTEKLANVEEPQLPLFFMRMKFKGGNEYFMTHNPQMPSNWAIRSLVYQLLGECLWHDLLKPSSDHVRQGSLNVLETTPMKQLLQEAVEHIDHCFPDIGIGNRNYETSEVLCLWLECHLMNCYFNELGNNFLSARTKAQQLRMRADNLLNEDVSPIAADFVLLFADPDGSDKALARYSRLYNNLLNRVYDIQDSNENKAVRLQIIAECLARAWFKCDQKLFVNFYQQERDDVFRVNSNNKSINDNLLLYWRCERLFNIYTWCQGTIK